MTMKTSGNRCRGLPRCSDARSCSSGDRPPADTARIILADVGHETFSLPSQFFEIVTLLGSWQNRVWDSFPWPQAPTTADVHRVERATDEILKLRANNLGTRRVRVRRGRGSPRPTARIEPRRRRHQHCPWSGTPFDVGR